MSKNFQQKRRTFKKRRYGGQDMPPPMSSISSQNNNQNMASNTSMPSGNFVLTMVGILGGSILSVWLLR